ncbi:MULTISPECIES: glutamate racemase [unclassified Granulicatella]|uniref:glutamate racemase n=1 Tax=unclassified Granulicatella TaxID=2630493 RepID=UPI0010740D5D|nr:MULTISPECIES: glutamate racemase [unclassified Granulicatella]MBF0780497.1 glutamate racemase [Granulicatella sp. 19428wC4_WM01]TFU95355.1 glutamate racemase [Granulicatella sp. WM01]
MTDNRPIGFIDSGFGGLSVVRESLYQLPNETIYFLGDSARCPYGPRTPQEVLQFTWEMADFLMEKNIKMLVVACNTATAAALKDLKEKLPIPVIGVINPGSRAAIKESKNNHIGVLGTLGTIRSGVYEETLKGKKSDLEVSNLACPSFVDIVENNQMNTLESFNDIERTLHALKSKDIDTLILGCTHYPLLKPTIQKIMGEDVVLIDSGVETITDVSMLLDYFDISADDTKKNNHRFFTTGEAKRFEVVAKQWLHLPELTVQTVRIEKEQEKNSMEKTILVATRNKGKAKEFESIFGKKGYRVKTLLDYPTIEDVEETGVTFEENARLKAETIAQQLQIMVIADDSGLMVDALNGQPGVYSARYAGEPKNDAANNAKLLAELSEYPNASRRAVFHCTLVLAIPNQESIVATGELVGEIARVPQGENGFGYDPLFYVPELQKTTAQLSADEKNSISHRKKAISVLLQKISEQGLLL